MILTSFNFPSSAFPPGPKTKRTSLARSLLGWLETRLAQIDYLNLRRDFATLTFARPRGAKLFLCGCMSMSLFHSLLFDVSCVFLLFCLFLLFETSGAKYGGMSALQSWVFITGGCSRRGVQWMGVVLSNKTTYIIM